MRVQAGSGLMVVAAAAMALAGLTDEARGAERFSVEELIKRSDVVWGFDFLPDGKILFTERGGKMGILDPKTKISAPVAGVPKVAPKGQGGLLDVRIHPEFPESRWIFFAYSEPVNGEATTVLARAELRGSELKAFRKLFTAREPNSNVIHFGSRIEFDREKHVFVSVGDRDQRVRAQDLAYHQGKILRINEDGSVPADNPFAKSPGARREIWSYGHRNPQGLARHPRTHELWSAEMGPLGGDELNLIKPGKNYGWPVITYGREYSGLKIGEGTEKPGMQQPVAHWEPSISPSAIAFYDGEAFPEWKGNLFLANLSGQHLRRLVLQGGAGASGEPKVVQQERLLEDLQLRFRGVRQGPDGLLYFSTDEGYISRLVPRR